MPNRLFIRICPVNSVESADLEVPADEPVLSILPDLLKVLDQPISVNKKHLHYSLRTEEDELLIEEKTLAEAGIENFQTLWLTIIADKSGNEVVNDSEETKNVNRDTLINDKVIPAVELPKGLRGIMSPSLWSQLPIEKPSLVSPSGLIFDLGDPPILIGRYSKDCSPSIDLTELDCGAVSSRKHVEISGGDDKFTLKALKTTNGTFLNGVKLNPEETIPLKDGDSIMFGIGGVRLIFCLPKY
jgi:hypothetical protein